LISRLEDGRIAQRPFGGASFPRTVYAADKTGHVLLHILFEQALSHDNIDFYNEFFLLDLLHNGERVKGVIVYDIKNGEVVTLQSKAVVLATGGFARIYWFRSTNAIGNTGDGQAVYAPEKMELAPRDLVSRAIEYEIMEGRGVGEGARAYIYLDLRHLGEERIKERLPQVRQLSIDFEGVDPVKDLVPIRPTAHYCMGGIHVTDYRTSETPLKGLYAIGECACVSVHGANRLGGNSLTELLVFGKFGGIAVREFVREHDYLKIEESEASAGVEFIKSLMEREGREKLSDIRARMGELTWAKMGIFRDEKSLKSAFEELSDLLDRWESIPVVDKSRVFNTNLIELLELRNMLELARAVAFAALHRRESRGGHTREDYPQRDDSRFLKHSVVYYRNGELKIDYIPVEITEFKPTERRY